MEKKYKFKTHSWKYSIDKVEILSETDKFVTVLGYDNKPKRESKTNIYSSYYDTWQLAQQSFIDNLNKKIKQNEDMLIELRKLLDHVYNLKEKP